MTLEQAIQAAYDADEAFELAVKAQGYKSRWDIEPIHSQELRDAYFRKVDADKAMNVAFAESRRAVS
jgi:hypothetical protein